MALGVAWFGVLSQFRRSLGFLSLFIADHAPSRTSPWFDMTALRLSLQSLAWMCFRVASSFTRYASFILMSLFVVISSFLARVLIPHLISVIFFVRFLLDLWQCFLAMETMLLLKSAQRVWSLQGLSVWFVSPGASRSNWSAIPCSIIFPINLSFFCLVSP